MLCHKRLGLLLDRGGAYRLVAFNPHGGLDSLSDFFVQLGADLHHFFPESNPPVRFRGKAWRLLLLIIISSVSVKAGRAMLSRVTRLIKAFFNTNAGY